MLLRLVLGLGMLLRLVLGVPLPRPALGVAAPPRPVWGVAPPRPAEGVPMLLCTGLGASPLVWAATGTSALPPPRPSLRVAPLTLAEVGVPRLPLPVAGASPPPRPAVGVTTVPLPGVGALPLPRPELGILATLPRPPAGCSSARAQSQTENRPSVTAHVIPRCQHCASAHTRCNYSGQPTTECPEHCVSHR